MLNHNAQKPNPAQSTLAIGNKFVMEIAPAIKPLEQTQGVTLWLRQISAILRMDIRKNFFGRRALLIYALAAVPVALFAATALHPETAREIRSSSESEMVFANLFEGLILRTVVFFGCAWMFMNLFRGEIVDKSIHYYFLAPIRREVLVLGKYISGLVASVVLFSLSTLGALVLFYATRGYLGDLLTNGKLGPAFTYVALTALGCLGYGAIFLVIGLFFRNPIMPGLFVYGWEWLNFLLPPVLKKISIIHYLHTLAPVPMPEGPMATIADNTPAWIAVPSFIVFTIVVLTLAAWRSRHLEVRYGTE